MISVFYPLSIAGAEWRRSVGGTLWSSVNTFPRGCKNKQKTMKLKELFTDDDAVSPVIGVILMVAITVILAAVIGAFVLDLGGTQNSAPQASFEFDERSNGSYDITHASGETIENGLTVQYNGGTTDSWNGPIKAGDYTATDNAVNADTEIKVIWESQDGKDSNVLASYEV